MATSEQIQGGFQILQAVSEAIREAGKIPSGTLYAVLCDKMDIGTYNKVISILKNSTVIRESGNVLYWNVD